MSYQQPTQYDDTNKVSLWPGDKSKNPNAPDLRGTINVNGQEFNISLWNNNKRQHQNSPAMKGKISDKNAAQRPPQQQNYGYTAAGAQVPQGHAGYAAPQQAQAVQQGFQNQAPQQGGFEDEIPF